MRITVFGGAIFKENDPVYQQSYQLGKYIAENGHTLLTGGYVGVMEAASRGAAEAGGHVVGVTCEDIERMYPIHANSWVKEEWHLPTMHEREWSLMQNCDLSIAMPGGMGTLSEITTVWNHLSMHNILMKAMIVYGEAWKRVFDGLLQNLGETIHAQDDSQIVFALTLEEVYKAISNFS